ncbi:hypothetical protein [Corynebacterium flavescens]|nr:hypothetical protein [Corynebacterium flavescens]
MDTEAHSEEESGTHCGAEPHHCQMPSFEPLRVISHVCLPF